MEAEELTKAVREFGEAFNAHDVERLVRYMSPDCVIVTQRSEIEGPFVGHEGVRRWAGDYFETAPDARVTLERTMALDRERVLMLGRQFGTAQTGGATFDAPLAVLVEIKGGLVMQLTTFPSHAEALEAAGLSE